MAVIASTLSPSLLSTWGAGQTSARVATLRRSNRVEAQRSGYPDRHLSREVLRMLAERDPGLGDHTTDVAAFAESVAVTLGLESGAVATVRMAAELHDVGKIAIPDGILFKRGPLDPAEWRCIERHTLIGERIIGGSPDLAPVAAMVRSSHERWDGNGYPDRLAAADIPLGARIVAVCDAFDAMTKDRSYRTGVSAAVAMVELWRCAGTQFDPAVVAAFERAVGPAPVRVPSAA